jgi:hypothetical protein
VNLKTTSFSSLESYSPYLLLQKVSKNPHAFAIHSNMPLQFIATCPKHKRPFFGHSRASRIKTYKFPMSLFIILIFYK